MSKLFGFIKTHVWQSVLIGVAVCGVISASIAVPIVLLNQKSEEQGGGGGGQQDIPDIDPEEQKTHATKVTPEPNAPFYLKVGQTKLVNVSFDQTPTEDKEKTFTWKSDDVNKAKLNKNKDEYKITEEMLTPEDTKGLKCAITGVSEGAVTVSATNDYNKSIVGYFYPNVINFSEKNNYLWEYKSEDRKEFGKQYTDVAIAEEHEVAYASALAKNGAKPIMCVMSSFVQRTYDQLSQDLCLNNSPATILVYWGGISGADVTHLGCFDIPFISNIPNMVYLAPTCKEEYLAMLEWAYKQNDHSVAIRVPFANITSFNNSWWSRIWLNIWLNISRVKEMTICSKFTCSIYFIIFT